MMHPFRVAALISSCLYFVYTLKRYLDSLSLYDLPTVPVNTLQTSNSIDRSLIPSLQFENFIWLVADAMSWLVSDKIRDGLREHSKIFKVQNNASIYTAVVAKTLITGRYNGAFTHVPPTGDHLFAAFNRGRSALSIRQYGDKVPFTFTPISSLPARHKTFISVDTIDDFLIACVRSHCKLFNDSTTKNDFFRQLDHWATQNQSLFYWSGISDHIMHYDGSHFNYTYPTLKRIADSFADDLMDLKAWIDEHPTYLLIVSADHGYDEPSLLSFT